MTFPGFATEELADGQHMLKKVALGTLYIQQFCNRILYQVPFDDIDSVGFDLLTTRIGTELAVTLTGPV